MHILKSAKHLQAIAILGLSVTVFTPKEAYAGITNPGSMCVSWGGPSPTINFSSIVAPGPDNTFVDCPMPMVNRSNALFGSSITVVDPNTGSHIVCRLNSVCWTGSEFIKNNSDTATSSHGLEILIFTPQVDEPRCGPLFAPAHWYISCQIPPGGRIVNYQACTSSGTGC